MGSERVGPIVIVDGLLAGSGPGLYYYDAEYPDDGTCGPFATREECIEHASKAYPELIEPKLWAVLKGVFPEDVGDPIRRWYVHAVVTSEGFAEQLANETLQPTRIERCSPVQIPGFKLIGGHYEEE